MLPLSTPRNTVILNQFPDLLLTPAYSPNTTSRSAVVTPSKLPHTPSHCKSILLSSLSAAKIGHSVTHNQLLRQSLTLARSKQLHSLLLLPLSSYPLLALITSPLFYPLSPAKIDLSITHNEFPRHTLTSTHSTQPHSLLLLPFQSFPTLLPSTSPFSYLFKQQRLATV